MNLRPFVAIAVLGTACVSLELPALCLFGASGNPLGVAAHESARRLPLTRMDEVTPHGRQLGEYQNMQVSGAHDVGRLVLEFKGRPTTGRLPRLDDPPDASCAQTGDFAYLVVPLDDAGTIGVLPLVGTLTVLPSGPDAGVAEDGGPMTALRLGDAGVPLTDGGLRPIADRRFEVGMPD